MMTRDGIFSFIQSMIQKFYQSSDRLLVNRIANSTSFEDLELTPTEVSRLIMSCEEKYGVDLGDAEYTSIQEVIDTLMSVADIVNAATSSEESTDASEDSDKLPPPETSEIPYMPAAATVEDMVADKEEEGDETEAKESSTEEETSQEG